MNSVYASHEPSKAYPVLVTVGGVVAIGGALLILASYQIFPIGVNAISNMGIWGAVTGYGTLGVGLALFAITGVKWRCAAKSTDLSQWDDSPDPLSVSETVERPAKPEPDFSGMVYIVEGHNGTRCRHSAIVPNLSWENGAPIEDSGAYIALEGNLSRELPLCGDQLVLPASLFEGIEDCNAIRFYHGEKLIQLICFQGMNKAKIQEPFDAALRLYSISEER